MVPTKEQVLTYSKILVGTLLVLHIHAPKFGKHSGTRTLLKRQTDNHLPPIDYRILFMS